MTSFGLNLLLTCMFVFYMKLINKFLWPCFVSFVFWYSFCPSDSKFATCSDDGTVRIWDFMKCHEEKILRGMLENQGGHETTWNVLDLVHFCYFGLGEVCSFVYVNYTVRYSSVTFIIRQLMTVNLMSTTSDTLVSFLTPSPFWWWFIKKHIKGYR